MLGRDGVFYHPTTRTYSVPETYRLAYESVFFKTGDGSCLHGWFFPAGGNANGTVVHFHGNAGNITGHFEFVRWMPAAGWNVLCFDYRGFGMSQGKCNRPATIDDGHAAIEYAKSRDDVDPNRIVIFGQSIGGAIGIVVAARRDDVCGIATDSAFSHYRRLAAWHVRRSPLLFALAWWVPKVLVSDGYDPIDYVGRISPQPIFLFQGTADRIIDWHMAEELYQAANDPKELWLIPDLDHTEALEVLAETARPRLLRFFQACVASVL